MNIKTLFVGIVMLFLGACSQVGTPEDVPAPPTEENLAIVPDEGIAAQATRYYNLGTTRSWINGTIYPPAVRGYPAYMIRCFGDPGTQVVVRWQRGYEQYRTSTFQGPSTRSITSAGYFDSSVSVSSGLWARYHAAQQNGNLQGCTWYGLRFY